MAEGQRPSNYSSCCSWIFRLIYALSTSTTVLPPIFLNILNLSIYPSSSIFFCQSINRPIPLPKYQYIIAADPGAGISSCFYWSAIHVTSQVLQPKLVNKWYWGRHTFTSLRGLSFCIFYHQWSRAEFSKCLQEVPFPGIETTQKFDI